MEPIVLDDLYFVDLEVWMFVNESYDGGLY